MSRMLLLTALAGPALSQQPRDVVVLRGVEPLDLTRADTPVRVQKRSERVVQVVWRVAENDEVQLPLTNPVRDLDVALAPDGGTLVVLAGGVRANEGLELYLVGKEGGIHVFDTRGGRRLPARFNDGLGSWPLMEGEHLVLFAYQREGNLEFRALDTRGHVHASRTLAATAEEIPAFRATLQGATGKVRVEFGEGEALEFPHPLAPRLEVSEGLLDFGRRPLGRPAARAVELRNSGFQDLVVELSTGTDDFAVDGPSARIVEPGGRTEVRVQFHARNGGPANDRLDIVSNAANGRVSVSLRGDAVPAESRIAPPATASPERPRVESEPAPSRTAERGPPALPRPILVELEPHSTGSVAVSGSLAAPPEDTEPPLRVRIRAGEGEPRVAALGPGLAFSLEVPAAPGAELFLSVLAADGRGSPERLIGHVLPTLKVEASGLVIEGPAGARFVLAAVQLDPGRQRVQRVLESWTGRLDRRGRVVLQPDALGLGSDPLDLVVLLPTHGDTGLMSKKIEWLGR